MAEVVQTGLTAKRALKALARMQARVDQLELAAREPIAVIGMGCRFPGNASNPESFWELLQSGVDAVTELPPDRWSVDRYYDPEPGMPGKSYVKRGAFVDGIDQFDARFFGISPREARSIDPQHRLLLEVAWESLEHAGIAPAKLAGTRTGVFAGIGQDDYGQLRLRSRDWPEVDTYDGTGNLFCFGPGRIAHILGLRGPNMAIDTACSSSLVAIHEACQTLRSGGCDLALAGGVHLTITAEVAIFLAQARVLAPDGHCKTFDASADGFGRGEGCGIIVLKRLSDAIADGDTVLALIRGSAVNHDGASSGLTVPNELAQAELIRTALHNAGVAPEQVSYVEAHGTGTSLGDPIEINAVADALCAGRTQDSPLLVGSVKTNIGHLEAAAGVAGLIKVVLALGRRHLPAHLHFNRPNPRIDWSQTPIEVTASGRTWDTSNGPRFAGVSSFGFSGTNAHVILEEPPGATRTEPPAAGTVHVLALSAKSEVALRDLARRYEERLRADTALVLADICATAALGRSHFDTRLALVTGTKAGMLEKLAAFRDRQPADGLHWRQAASGGGAARQPGGQPLYRPSDKPSDNTPARLAQLYVAGSETELCDRYRQSGYRSVALPTYPFQRERHWVAAAEPDRSSPQRRAGPGSGHPLLGHRVLAASFGDDEIVFESTIGGGSPEFFADHRVFDAIVMPASAIVELALAAGRFMLRTRQISLAGLDVDRALVLPEEGELVIQISLRREAANECSFRIHRLAGQPSPDGTAPGGWIEHASGRIVGSPPQARNPAIDMDALRARFQEPLDVADAYAEFARRGVAFGPTFQCLRRIWRHQDEILAEVTLAESMLADADLYHLHPTLLDACFQASAVGLFDDGDVAYVPVGVERLTLFERPGPQVWCHAVTRRLSGGSVIDLKLYNEQGTALTSITGLALRKTGQQAFLPESQSPAGQDLYEVQWRPTPGRQQDSSRANSPNNWLILMDRQGVGASLADLFRHRGDRVIAICPGDSLQLDDGGRGQLDPEQPADFDQLLEIMGKRSSGPWKLIHCWSLDAAGACSDPSIEEALSLGCGSLLALLAAHHRIRESLLSDCWLITRGAQSVAAHARPVRPQQAPLWGLQKTLAIEQPGLNSTCIDLDPADDTAEVGLLINEMTNEMASRGQSESVAIRAGERHVARLAPYRLPDAVAPRFDAGACYLIAGGLGALGLQVAEWMSHSGARALVLCSRGEPSPDARDMAEKLATQGTEVRMVQADIAVEADVAGLLAEIDRSQKPLRGIVNAAGVVDDAPLENLDLERLRRTMRPKALGSWNLHRMTLDCELDFFVCFSSSAAVMGSAGQGNYAAANAFMDALVADRQSEGLCSLGVNWGAWSGPGMAAEVSATHQARWRARGLASLSPERGLQILGRLIPGSASVCAVAVQWNQYLAATYGANIPPFYEGLAKPEHPERAAIAPTLTEELAHVSQQERHAMMATAVRTEVASTLGLSSPEAVEPRTSLFEQGIDSLMATELTRRLETKLGRRLGSTAVFNHPTVELLVDRILQELFPLSPAPRVAAPQAEESTAQSGREESLDEAFAAELAALESLVGEVGK